MVQLLRCTKSIQDIPEGYACRNNHVAPWSILMR